MFNYSVLSSSEIIWLIVPSTILIDFSCPYYISTSSVDIVSICAFIISTSTRQLNVGLSSGYTIVSIAFDFWLCIDIPSVLNVKYMSFLSYAVINKLILSNIFNNYVLLTFIVLS